MAPRSLTLLVAVTWILGIKSVQAPVRSMLYCSTVAVLKSQICAQCVRPSQLNLLRFHILTMASAGATDGQLSVDFIATRPPKEILEPHGRSSFALQDGVSTSLDAKRLSVDMEALAEAERSGSVIDKEKYPIPTEQELSTLRKVSDSIPAVAYLLCIVEFAERASYYGVQTVFTNFMEYPLPDGQYDVFCYVPHSSFDCFYRWQWRRRATQRKRRDSRSTWQGSPIC